MNYQRVKYKKLIYVQIITDVEVYPSMLESYSEIRKQIS